MVLRQNPVIHVLAFAVGVDVDGQGDVVAFQDDDVLVLAVALDVDGLGLCYSQRQSQKQSEQQVLSHDRSLPQKCAMQDCQGNVAPNESGFLIPDCFEAHQGFIQDY
jgi:hypothetical protein